MYTYKYMAHAMVCLGWEVGNMDWEKRNWIWAVKEGVNLVVKQKVKMRWR